MSSITSIATTLGAGSGIDMAGLANDLAVAQFQARTQMLGSRSEQLTNKISTASTIKNALSQLASSLGDRVRIGDLAATPTINRPSVATVSAPIGSSGSGTYSLEVMALARNQVATSPAFASAQQAVGSGTLTFTFGPVTGAGLTPDAGHATVDISIASGATLVDVATAINGAGAGLTAYIADTGEGSRLVIKGPDGASNGFSVAATEGPKPGLSALAFDPVANADRLMAGAADAIFKLDGVTRTSPTNKIDQIAPGLSIQLQSTNVGDPASIGFGDPVDAISTAMADLVGALNEVASELQAAMDAKGGDLASDPGARALRQALSSLAGEAVMPSASATAPKTLADLGLATNRDGTFRLDSSRLQATLSRDPSGAAAMFTTGLYGVYATVDRVARNASKATGAASLGSSIARYQKQATSITDQTTKLAEQQEKLRASLVSRFTKADSRVSASKSTLSFLQAQIDAWNAQKN